MKNKSVLSCPKCGFESEEVMPVDACVHFYQCKECGEMITPKAGDCCVFCSYGDEKCPSKQGLVLSS